MTNPRVAKLNSLLKKVISQVISREVRNPDLAEFTTVSRVDISKDLRYAKVYISVIGDEEEKNRTIKTLQSAAGFISVMSSKNVVMRFFPSLTFILDDTVDRQMQIEELLQKIHEEEDSRTDNSNEEERGAQ